MAQRDRRLAWRLFITAKDERKARKVVDRYRSSTLRPRFAHPCILVSDDLPDANNLATEFIETFWDNPQALAPISVASPAVAHGRTLTRQSRPGGGGSYLWLSAAALQTFSGLHEAGALALADRRSSP